MKIKDTKIGKFLAEKAPGALGIVGDLLPNSGTLGIVKNAIKKYTVVNQIDQLELDIEKAVTKIYTEINKDKEFLEMSL